MIGSGELCISIQEKTFRFAICKFNKKNKKVEVSKAFQIEIPDDFGTARNPANAGAISGLIKTVLKDNKIRLKTYSLCISDKEVVTRVIKLPKMPFKDLNSFVNLSIQQYFPIRSEGYSFDYKVQSINENDEQNYYNLFLVAIPTSIIEYYCGILLKCGLRPKKVDIYADVVSEVFHEFIGSDIAVVDMSYNFTEFAILEGNSIFINSMINYMLPRTKDVENEEEFLKHLNEERLGEDFPSTYETIKSYLNFFSSRHNGKTIEEVYFIGEGAMLEDILSLVKDELNVKIKTGRDILNEHLNIAMPELMKEQFKPERYISCIGLVVEGRT